MNTNKLFLLLSVATLLMSINAFSQKKVENLAFNTMLQVLLKHNVPEISAVNANKGFDDYIFLDAREKNEFEVSHIKNAIWIGFSDFDIDRVKSISKGKKIIVYCSIGARSEQLSNKLLAADYINVSNMYGGIFEWVNNGFNVYNQSNKPTNKVHAYNKKWGIWLKKGEKVY